MCAYMRLDSVCSAVFMCIVYTDKIPLFFSVSLSPSLSQVLSLLLYLYLSIFCSMSPSTHRSIYLDLDFNSDTYSPEKWRQYHSIQINIYHSQTLQSSEVSTWLCCQTQQCLWNLVYLLHVVSQSITSYNSPMYWLAVTYWRHMAIYLGHHWLR